MCTSLSSPSRSAIRLSSSSRSASLSACSLLILSSKSAAARSSSDRTCANQERARDDVRAMLRGARKGLLIG